MIKIQSAVLKSSVGFEARKLRASLGLTQQELVINKGFSVKDISLLERDLPLPMDRRLNILHELWAREVYAKGGSIFRLLL